MVQDYSWMQEETAGSVEGTSPNKSNPKVIVIDEQSDGDEVSHHDWSLGNAFTGPVHMVAGPYGHGGALPPSHPHDSNDKNKDFYTMIQSLEGIIPLSMVNADNDPHSEVLSSDNFALPEGGYPAPYVSENLQGLFLHLPGAPGLLTCRYHHTSLRDHPLHCHGHSYTEGSERVGMYPSQHGLVDTGVGYRDSLHSKERRSSYNHQEIQ